MSCQLETEQVEQFDIKLQSGMHITPVAPIVLSV